MPATMHRISPGETRLHVADLPAAVAALPVAQYVPDTGLRSDETKRSSHCTAAGCAPPLELRPTPTVILAPGAPDPPDSESDTLCDHTALTATTLKSVSLMHLAPYTTRLGLVIYVADPVLFLLTSF